jgi:hypothetical protein
MEIDIDAMLGNLDAKFDQTKRHIQKVAAGEEDDEEDDEPTLGIVTPTNSAEKKTDDIMDVVDAALGGGSSGTALKTTSTSSIIDQLLGAAETAKAAPRKGSTMDASDWKLGAGYLTCPDCFAAYLLPRGLSAGSRAKAKCSACGSTFSTQGTFSELTASEKVVKFPEEAQKQVNAKKGMGETKVVIRNLPYDAKDNEVKVFLTVAFGECKEFFPLKNPDGSFKGVGFAKFARWYDAKRAIDAAEAKLLKFRGRPVSIAEAYDQKPVKAR